MHSSMGTVRCSFVVAARQESAVFGSTGAVVVAVRVKEHAVELDRSAVVETDLGGSVLEMVPRRSCRGLLAAADTIGEARSALCFGCSTLQLDLP